MGGVNSQGFRQFSELLVKSFLACRPFVDDICATARLMIGTDLPAYRFGLGTIDRLRDRFKPDLSERQAAEYMLSLLANAKFSNKSILYDQFQTLQVRRRAFVMRLTSCRTESRSEGEGRDAELTAAVQALSSIDRPSVRPRSAVKSLQVHATCLLSSYKCTRASPSISGDLPTSGDVSPPPSSSGACFSSSTAPPR